MKKLLTFLILPMFAILGLQAQTDVTSTYVVNPNFDEGTIGWISTTGAQNRALAHNQDAGAFAGTMPYYENWNDAAYTGKIYQVLKNLPSGDYTLKMGVFANNGGEGLFVYGGDAETPVSEAGVPAFFTVDFATPGGSVEIGLNIKSGTNNWVGIDNISLFYNGPTTEKLFTVDKTELGFDAVNTKREFVVAGVNLTEGITLTAPAGITLDKYSIGQAEADGGVTVTATYDGSADIPEGVINVTSGDLSHSILVTATNADFSCYTPLYTDRPNLIPDPLVTSLSNFGGWGEKEIVTDYVYCGATAAKIIGAGGGSLDVSLTNILKPNTNYRVKVMVSTNGTGEAQIGVDQAAGTLIENKFSTQENEWIALDFAFTTQANLVNPLMYINNYNLPSLEVYIDNWELYELFDAPTLVVNPVELIFDAINPVNQFEVKGTNLLEDITITSPTSIVLDINSISTGDAYDGVIVTAEYDFDELIEDGVIEVKSGDVVSNITVNAFNFTEGECFEPLYSDKENLIKDPFLNSLATYAGWGNREIISDERAFCFRSVYVDGRCGGSLDYHLTGIVKPYTTYRVRAKVSTNGTGTGKIGISGLGIPNVYQPFESEAGQYITIDFVFTTGGSLNNPNMYLNSCESETATELYLDNYEMYELNDPAIVIDPEVISFDSMHTLDSVLVLGQNLSENITVTAPEGVTLEVNTIDAVDAATGVYVNLNYDKSVDIVGGEVTLTSGELSKTLIVNASRYLINGDFERPITEGWTTNDGDMVRQTNNSFPLKTGGHYVEKWVSGGGNLSAFTLSQTILGIPNGSYTLKANAQAVQQADDTNPGGAFIIANNNGVEVIETAEYSVDVDVVDESLTVGFQVVMTGNWVAVDNFRLIDNNESGVNNRHSLDGVNTFILNNRVHADINLDKNATTTISVYNINGVKMAEKEVALQAGENRVVVDKELARGVYLVEVVADGKFAAFKLIK